MLLILYLDARAYHLCVHAGLQRDHDQRYVHLDRLSVECWDDVAVIVAGQEGIVSALCVHHLARVAN